jgi:hypothetical protein
MINYQPGVVACTTRALRNNLPGPKLPNTVMLSKVLLDAVLASKLELGEQFLQLAARFGRCGGLHGFGHVRGGFRE